MVYYNYVGNAIEMKRKLYQKHKDFKKFQELTDIEIESIRNDITFLKQNHTGLDLYFRTLNLLVNEYKLHYNFDMKMFALIETCDPELVTLNAFKEFERPDRDSIEYQQYLNKVRDILGFCDENLRIFEAVYAKRFLSTEKKLDRTKNN